VIGELDARAADLPVRAVLKPLTRAAAKGGGVVVHAPPGSGKTTLVPPALASLGRVVVTQPRRIAARAAAQRLADLLDEPIGERVGYTVRGERRRSDATIIEFVTTGVLLRRLQRDPELPGVAAVVLDEVHERQLDSDLLLALLVDVRDHLRPDLAVTAMSATIEGHRTAKLLGPGTPILDVAVEDHPVTVRWRPAREQRLDDRGVTPAFLDHVARVVREALDAAPGDLLAFVPGAGEVDRLCRALRGVDAEVLPLHGRLPAQAQQAALRDGANRRVVVATDVAESSLTVPGVRIVVDAGLAREPRMDHRRGLPGLVTRYVSQAAATQRAGRAGRLGPGVVYRCWSQADHARLASHTLPEIATADLTAFLLEVKRWGSVDGNDLALLDQPPEAALRAAAANLEELGLLDGRQLSPLGHRVAQLGVDPRLGRALLSSIPRVGVDRSTELVALLSAGITAPGADIAASLREARRDRGGAGAAWSAEVRRLRRAMRRAGGGSDTRGAAMGDDVAAGYVIALAHPQRIARRRAETTSYLMALGTAARLPPGSPLQGAPWLAIADVDRQPGRDEAVIRAAAVLDEDAAVEAAAGLRDTVDEVAWRDGAVVARRREMLGSIELSSTPLRRPDPQRLAATILAEVARQGVGVLPWPPAAVELRQRMAFLHHQVGEPWPDVSDAALGGRLEEWLAPVLAGVRSTEELGNLDLGEGLRALLPWPAAARLDDLAPGAITVPSGSRIAVNYDDPDRPVLAVRIQEVFGWQSAPRLADGRVGLVLELLSPARRPAAVTADLAGFWSGSYDEVRRELRGRYPKHSWPADPATAEPTRGTARRR